MVALLVIPLQRDNPSVQGFNLPFQKVRFVFSVQGVQAAGTIAIVKHRVVTEFRNCGQLSSKQSEFMIILTRMKHLWFEWTGSWLSGRPVHLRARLKGTDGHLVLSYGEAS